MPAHAHSPSQSDADSTTSTKFSISDYLTWYRRPDFQDVKSYASSIRSGESGDSTGQQSVDSRTSTMSGVPKSMNFDRLLQNKTRAPIALYDFYMYLKFVEFSSENLEFYLWYQNYRANYQYSAAEKRPATNDTTATTKEHRPVDPQACIDTMNRIYDLVGLKTSYAHEREEEQRNNPFASSADMESGHAPSRPSSTANLNRHPQTPMAHDRSSSPPSPISTTPSAASTIAVTTTTVTTNVLRKLPSVAPPAAPSYREEIDTIVKLFLVPGAERELNIPAPLRAQAMVSLQTSTDPHILAPIAEHVLQTLRNCSHRNFVRMAVSSGTYNTICASTMLGGKIFLIGTLTVLTRMLVPRMHMHSQFEAFIGWPFWFLGAGFMFSGLRNCCFFLVFAGVRQLLPWEHFNDKSSVFEALQARNQPQPKRNPIAAFFHIVTHTVITDKKLRVKAGEVRDLQWLIWFQGAMGGIIVANIMVLIFIFLPAWR